MTTNAHLTGTALDLETRREMEMDKAYYDSKFHCLWSGGTLTCTAKELRAFMLGTGGQILVRGRLRDVKKVNLGAGAYRVELGGDVNG